MSRPPRNEERVTLQAVARRAGVTAMTVSNVINGAGRASEATRGRVLAAVADLGYRPNLAARHLAGTALSRLGLVYAGVESVFIDATVTAIAVIAAERGIHLQIQAVDHATPEASADVAHALVRSGAQALLLLPPYAEILGTLPGADVPIAAIATAVPLPHAFTIRIDNRAASRAVTERLIAAGRRRIGVLAGPQHHSDGAARLRGYRDALATHGLPDLPALCVEGDFTFQSGIEAARRLLDADPRPDAIVAANDDMAAAVLWLAHQRGLALPADLAVTGFDDTLIATRVWPALTTVHQPIKAMAAKAIECLDRAIRNPGSAERGRDFVLPFELVGRASA